MTAASVRILQRQPKGVKDHSLAAKNIFENIKEKNNSNFFCGLNLDELINFTEFLNNNSDGFKVNGNINPEVLFEYFLSVNNSFK